MKFPEFAGSSQRMHEPQVQVWWSLESARSTPSRLHSTSSRVRAHTPWQSRGPYPGGSVKLLGLLHMKKWIGFEKEKETKRNFSLCWCIPRLRGRRSRGCLQCWRHAHDPTCLHPQGPGYWHFLRGFEDYFCLGCAALHCIALGCWQILCCESLWNRCLFLGKLRCRWCRASSDSDSLDKNRDQFWVCWWFQPGLFNQNLTK